MVPSDRVLGAPAARAHALSYLGSFGDLVQFGDQLGAWDTRDHEKDQGFQLDLAATTVNNLVAIRMTTSGGTWQTVAGDGAWAIGVTIRAHGKLINNADSSIQWIWPAVCGSISTCNGAAT